MREFRCLRHQNQSVFLCIITWPAFLSTRYSSTVMGKSKLEIKMCAAYFQDKYSSLNLVTSPAVCPIILDLIDQSKVLPNLDTMSCVTSVYTRSVSYRLIRMVSIMIYQQQSIHSCKLLKTKKRLPVHIKQHMSYGYGLAGHYLK